MLLRKNGKAMQNVVENNQTRKKMNKTNGKNMNNNKLVFDNVHSISTKQYQISTNALFCEKGKSSWVVVL